MSDIVFEFITEANKLDLYDLACTAFNLALCYFYWDIFKFVINLFKYVFRRYEK